MWFTDHATTALYDHRQHRRGDQTLEASMSGTGEFAPARRPLPQVAARPRFQPAPPRMKCSNETTNSSARSVYHIKNERDWSAK
jgi:hypothetical protein